MLAGAEVCGSSTSLNEFLGGRIMKLSTILLSIFVFLPMTVLAADEPVKQVTVTGFGMGDSAVSELIARDFANRQAELNAYSQCGGYGMVIQNMGYPSVTCGSLTIGGQTNYHCSAWVTATCQKAAE
jgi:hypothetical protein